MRAFSSPAFPELEPAVRDLKISVRLVVDAFYVCAVRAQIVPDPLGLRAARLDFNDGDRGHANDKRGATYWPPLLGRLCREQHYALRSTRPANAPVWSSPSIKTWPLTRVYS